MAVKIRLARKGRKKLAYYHIVVADSKSPRDGRYIEKIGIYNPITDPATIELNFDKALDWLQKGAQPTETCRAILSYKGILLKKHLLEGVRKGAFDEAEAERRFEEWMKQQETKIDAKKTRLEKTADDIRKKQVETEKRISDARAEEIARKNAQLAASETEEMEKTAETVEATEEKASDEVAEVTDSDTAAVITDTPEEPVEEVSEDTESEPAGEEKPQE